MEIRQLQEDIPLPEGPRGKSKAGTEGLLPPTSTQMARPRLLVASRTELASTCETVLPPVEKVPMPSSQIPSFSRFTLAEKVYGRGSKPPQSWRTVTARQWSDMNASKPAWTGAVEPMNTSLPAQKPSEAAPKRKVIVLPRLAPDKELAALRPRGFPCFVVRIPDAVKQPPIIVPTALPRPLEGRAARLPSGGHKKKREAEEDLAASRAALPSGSHEASFSHAAETVQAPLGSAPLPDERSCDDAMAEEAAQDVVAWLVSGLRFSGAKAVAPLQERWMPLPEERPLEEEMAEEAAHQVVAWLMAGLRISHPEEQLAVNEHFLLLADVHSVQSWRSEMDEAVEQTVEELLPRLVRLEVSEASAQDESEHDSWEWADQEWFEEALDLALEDMDWDACKGIEEDAASC